MKRLPVTEFNGGILSKINSYFFKFLLKTKHFFILKKNYHFSHLSTLHQIFAYLIGNLMRITKKAISKVYDQYFLSYSEKTDGIPPLTNLGIPPLDGFTLVRLPFADWGC